jgi:hypothetical protein
MRLSVLADNTAFVFQERLVKRIANPTSRRLVGREGSTITGNTVTGGARGLGASVGGNNDTTNGPNISPQSLHGRMAPKLCAE